MQNNSSIAAFIDFHAWWPSSADPFYVYNTTDNTARINYYNITGVPNYRYDSYSVGTNVNGWQTQIQNRALVDSPLVLTLTPSYDEVARTGTMGVQIDVVGSISSSTYVLRMAITESGLAAVGYTWNCVLRDLIPNNNGTTVDIYNDPSIYVEIPFQVKSNMNQDNCEIVVWVQNDGTKEVLQAAKWDVQPTADCQINIAQGSLSLSLPSGAGCPPTEADLNFTVDNCDSSVIFESSNIDVATVDGTGHVQAISVGSATITAYCESDPACDDTCSVNVISCSEQPSEVPISTASILAFGLLSALGGLYFRKKN